MARYYIGIDPGVNTGVAVWDKKEKAFKYFSTTDFWELIEGIGSLGWTEEDKEDHVVCIEDPNVNKPLFANKKGSTKSLIKIAQNVGSNKREASLLIDFFERNGIAFKALPPSRKGKLSSEQFKAYTGYTGRTNEHVRDAAMLVFGR